MKFDAQNTMLQSDLPSEAIQQRKSLKYLVWSKMEFLFPKRLLTLADYHNSLEILALRHLWADVFSISTESG